MNAIVAPAQASDVLLAARIQAAAEFVSTVVSSGQATSLSTATAKAFADAVAFLDSQWNKGESH